MYKKRGQKGGGRGDGQRGGCLKRGGRGEGGQKRGGRVGGVGEMVEERNCSLTMLMYFQGWGMCCRGCSREYWSLTMLLYYRGRYYCVQFVISIILTRGTMVNKRGNVAFGELGNL